MTNQDSSTDRTPTQLWVEFEQQVVAANTLWQAYEKASVIADVIAEQYQVAARVRGEAYIAWCKANRSLDGIWHAYQVAQARGA